jgi:hypothetical protein
MDEENGGQKCSDSEPEEEFFESDHQETTDRNVSPPPSPLKTTAPIISDSEDYDKTGMDHGESDQEYQDGTSSEHEEDTSKNLGPALPKREDSLDRTHVHQKTHSDEEIILHITSPQTSPLLSSTQQLGTSQEVVVLEEPPTEEPPNNPSQPPILDLGAPLLQATSDALESPLPSSSPKQATSQSNSSHYSASRKDPLYGEPDILPSNSFFFEHSTLQNLSPVTSPESLPTSRESLEKTEKHSEKEHANDEILVPPPKPSSNTQQREILQENLEEKSSSKQDQATPSLPLYLNTVERSKRLNELYRAPNFFSNFFSSSSIDPEIADLLLLSHEEFLALPLDEINSFSSQKLHYVYERLAYLEQTQPAPSLRDVTEQERESPTLAVFRHLNVDSFVFFVDIPERCLGLLSSTQIRNINRSNDRDEFLDENLNSAVLQKMDIETVKRIGSLFSPSHIELLSDEVLKHPSFPWDKYIDDGSIGSTLRSFSQRKEGTFLGEIQHLIPWAQLNDMAVRHFTNSLSSSKEEKRITKNIFSQLSIENLLKLAPHLCAADLSLLPEAIFQRQEFPWKIFINKPGIGVGLRALSPQLLGEMQQRISWEDLIKASKGKEIAGFLITSSKSNVETTKNILSAFTIQTVQILAPALSPAHLLLFPEPILTHPEFPWMEFIKKKDIDEALRQLSPQLLGEMQQRISWTQLITTTQNNVAIFLNISSAQNQQTTIAILAQFNIQTIRALSPALSPLHLSLLPELILKHLEFPWMEFTKKDGFGKELQKLSPQIIGEVQKNIPWSQVFKEIGRFLPTANAQETTTAILSQLTIETIRTLSPALSPLHLHCLPEHILQHQEFPWMEFIKKDGFVKALRKLSPQIIGEAQKYIPWDLIPQNNNQEFLRTNTSEEQAAATAIFSQFDAKTIQVLPPADVVTFLNKQPDQYQLTIFSRFDIETFRKLSPALSPLHLSLFPELILTHPEFPWVEFIKKDGFGQELRKLSPQIIGEVQKNIPWSQFFKEIDRFLPTERDQDTTTAILSQLTIETIGMLSPALSSPHLRCLPEHILQHQEFPWMEFIKKKGFVKELRKLSPQIIGKAQHFIPWTQLIQKDPRKELLSANPEGDRTVSAAIFFQLNIKTIQMLPPVDVATLLNISAKQDSEMTTSLLSQLDIETIRTLSPALSSTHLFLFPELLLKHPEFPWEEFIKKEGFGQELRKLSPQIIGEVQKNIPWSQFFKEIGRFLPTERDQETTTVILSQLTIETIRTLSPALSSLHLHCLPEHILQHQDFPWAEFIKKDRFVKELRKLSPQIIGKAQHFIPWAQLIQRDHGNDFLSTQSAEARTLSAAILFQLNIQTIEMLSQVLEPIHLSLLPQEILQHPAFPWAILIQKRGIGKILRTLPPQLIDKIQHFIVSKELIENELSDFLCIASEDDKQITATILSQINIDNIIVLSPKLSLNHLLFIPPNILTDPSFPWELFIHRHGIGIVLRKLPPQLLGSIQNHWRLIKNTLELTVDLLALSSERKIPRTRAIVSEFSMETIQVLKAAFSPNLLLVFSEEVLKNDAFPWQTFIEKKGIGKVLRKLSPELLIAVQNLIPWKLLKKSEADNLFALKSDEDTPFVKEILAALDFQAIDACIPSFSKGHFLLFGDRLQDPQFPWRQVSSDLRMQFRKN